MKRHLLTSIMLLQALLMPEIAAGNDADREWEQQIVDKLSDKLPGQVVKLESQGHEFLALFQRPDQLDVRGTVILLHAMGGHADWPNVVSPLRNRLPSAGWATLSIQLPVLSPENQVEDYGRTIKQGVRRIAAAVAYLQQQDLLNIVLMGYSFGAVNGLAYLVDQKEPTVQALVMVGLQDYPYMKPTVDTLAMLEQVDVPVMDIYGSAESERALKLVPDRRLSASKAGNDLYLQLMIDNADHNYSNVEDELVKQITDWLDEIMLYQYVAGENAPSAGTSKGNGNHRLRGFSGDKFDPQ